MSRRFACRSSSRRGVGILFFILPAMGLVLSATLSGRAIQGFARSIQPAPRPGAWTQLGLAQGGSTAAVVHAANGNDLVVWTAPVAGRKFHYNAVQLKPTGGMASAPTDVFGGQDWDGVGFSPTLVSQGGQPLLVFEGGRDSSGDLYSHGCIVGDLLTSSGWTLQPWSLSAHCTNPDHFGATIRQDGTLAAAYPGGWANGNGILYRVGASSTVPATSDDQHISTAPGDGGMVGAATDASSQDVYAAYARFFSNPASQDGIWAADLSKGSAPLKAPDTGTNVVAHQYEPVAIASPTNRGGIYLAYPNNTSPYTKVELWRYGDSKAVTVPKSSNPTSVSISAGPSGRLWIAWWSEKNGTVRVVRTNEAGNVFGPVETHAGPHGCKGDGIGSIKISSGSQQRLDVLMTCSDFITTPVVPHTSATQSLVPLQISTATGSINHKKGGSVTYRVSDVGDAVAGAKVTVNGKKGTTDANGQVTFHFSKGAGKGSFRVVATMADYLSAATFLRIK